VFVFNTRLLLLLLPLLTFSVDIFAANIGEYRIYLDQDNRSKKFQVSNESNLVEKCKLDFAYQQYKIGGEAVSGASVDLQKQLSEPALSRLRYSPKSFTIEPKRTQYITFSLRRKINDPANEFRTYLLVKCVKQEEIKAEVGVISLSPQLILKIPLIVRTGKLSGGVEFKNIAKDVNKGLSFELHLKGERSVYGDAFLVDVVTGEEYIKRKGIAIYPESGHRRLTIPLSNKIAERKLRLVFKERELYGGNSEDSIEF
jgi:hypothetical protein